MLQLPPFKVIISTSLLTMLVACSDGNNATSNTGNTSATTQTTPTTQASAPEENYTERYTVGVDTSYPPFTNTDEHGTPSGFEIEILQAIAKDQKFGLDLIPVAERNTLYPDLEAGKYQILSASLKPNPERLTKSDFTDGYAQSNHTLLSRKDKVAKSGKELPALDTVTAVQESTNSQKLLEDLGVKMNLQPSVFTAFKEFMSGKADHVTGDSVALAYYLRQHAPNNLDDYVFHPFDDTGDREMAYAVTKGNADLLNKMNTGLANIKANGKYDEIYNRYFTTPDASTNKK